MLSATIVLLIYAAGILAGLWFVFKKAGKPSWAVLIPVYNLYVWLRIIKKPVWWFVFLAIPFISVFMVMLMLVETAKTFRKYRMWEQGAAVLLAFAYIPYLGLSTKEAYTHPDKLPPFKKSKAREWADAIIFAVVAALIIRTFLIEAYTIPTSSMEGSLLVGDFLFVSKYAYGPKAPNTPLTVPFTHHTMPVIGGKSYSEAIKLPYHRFRGLGKVKRGDAVVFNYPSGDTVILGEDATNYYIALMDAEIMAKARFGSEYQPGMGRQLLYQQFGDRIIARPVDKRENYIKRCVAIAGDTLEIKNREIYINGVKTATPQGVQYSYMITVDGSAYLDQLWEKYNITDIGQFMHGYIVHTTPAIAEKIRSSRIPGISSIDMYPQQPGNAIFPQDTLNFHWSLDNFGPLYIPKAGDRIELTPQNLSLYRRAIVVYEGNKLESRDGKVYLNDQPATHYTFKMNYYWMMGDNRHNSLDSRYWGFVPEDHVVGKAVFVWASLDKNKGWLNGKIRWDKLFRKVR
ncbi:MAG TPA: signal peptidase I [Bacteroidales bacterium]|nr:signal peptidase I [Bacteroidales bacterium]HRZ49340.1 signal peptidase I [Bacteroidales bacterium]